MKIETPKDAKVPSIWVKLVQSLWLSPQQSAIVQVHVCIQGVGSPVYVECNPHLEDETGLCIEDVLLQPNADGRVWMVVSNLSSYIQVAEGGATIREVITAAVVEAGGSLEPISNE